MSAASAELVSPSHKYALIALGTAVDDAVSSHVDLGGGLHATRTLELSVPGHWKEWLGSVMWEELHKQSLLFWAIAPSANPQVMDEENSKLQNRVWMLYYGLMLAAPRIATGGRGFVLTGARSNEVDVRQVGWIPALPRNQGVFWDPIRPNELVDAVTLGEAIGAIQHVMPFRRLRAALRCYYTGLQADDPAERIHEFVRTIEGCILPARGGTEAQFVRRTELFVGPREHEWAHALFAVRSAVEHLNDRLESVAMPERKDGALRVLRLAHDAQAVARYCLRRVFSNAALREYFRDDAALGEFWRLPEDERRKAWGERLDLEPVRNEINAEFVNSE